MKNQLLNVGKLYHTWILSDQQNDKYEEKNAMNHELIMTSPFEKK